MTWHRLLMSLAALCAIASLSVCAAGCGGANGNATGAAGPGVSSQVTTDAYFEETKPDADHDSDREEPDEDDGSKPTATDGDGDNDSSARGRYDGDDSKTVHLGHAASGSEGAAIAALVRRYYSAAYKQDGAEACSMLYSIFAEAVPEDYGTVPPGPGYARGTTCQAVLTKVFSHFREKIAYDVPRLQISQIRVLRRSGIVLLSFGSRPERVIHIMREGHSWRIMSMLDEAMR